MSSQVHWNLNSLHSSLLSKIHSIFLAYSKQKRHTEMNSAYTIFMILTILLDTYKCIQTVRNLFIGLATYDYNAGEMTHMKTTRKTHNNDGEK